MNRNLIAAVVLLTLGAEAQTVSSSTDQKPGTEFQVVSAGPHQNVWQKTVLDDHGLTNWLGRAEFEDNKGWEIFVDESPPATNSRFYQIGWKSKIKTID